MNFKTHSFKRGIMEAWPIAEMLDYKLRIDYSINC